jgi:hypothetical protein
MSQIGSQGGVYDAVAVRASSASADSLFVFDPVTGTNTDVVHSY